MNFLHIPNNTQDLTNLRSLTNASLGSMSRAVQTAPGYLINWQRCANYCQTSMSKCQFSNWHALKILRSRYQNSEHFDSASRIAPEWTTEISWSRYFDLIFQAKIILTIFKVYSHTKNLLHSILSSFHFIHTHSCLPSHYNKIITYYVVNTILSFK